ncbi:MAG: hypothetical protein U1D30_06020 [Planctomycetota bacterium]
MIELLKKTMLTGIGLAVLTKDKVEELGREMIKQGEISEKEGKEFVDDLLQKSEDARKDFGEQMDKVVKNAVDRMNLATREEIAALSERIARLEAALASQGKG